MADPEPVGDPRPVVVPLLQEDSDDPNEIVTIKVMLLDNPDDLTLGGESEEIRDKQKVKNREAAAKCRQRRKDRENKLTEENNKLKSENTILRYQVRQCRTEAERLRTAIGAHLASCSVRDVALQQLILVNDSMMCGEVETSQQEATAGDFEGTAQRSLPGPSRVMTESEMSFPDNELGVKLGVPELPPLAAYPEGSHQLVGEAGGVTELV